MATAAPGTTPPPPLLEEVPVKKKKMTKAERKAKKEKERIDFKKLEIREHLKRELALSKKSVRCGKVLWEDLCKEIRIVELYQELQSWNVKVNRLFQAKDDQIEAMMRDMDLTEDMHMRGHNMQMKRMEYLQGCVKTLVAASKEIYCSLAAESVEEFYLQMKEYEKVKTSFKEHCENVMHTTNMFVECDLQNNCKIFLMRRDDVVNEEIENRYVHRDHVVLLMLELHKQLMRFIDVVEEANMDPEKYEQIGILTKQQRNFQEETKRLDKSEMQLSRQLNELTHRFNEAELAHERHMHNLHLELSYFSAAHNNIEERMESDRMETFARLQVLANNTYDLRKSFEKLENKGELLLSVSASCRKFQTEAEKVVPWGNFQMPEQKVLPGEDADEERFHFDGLNLKQHLDLSEEELALQLSLLRRFWERKGIVAAQNMLLQRRRKELRAENEKYRNMIRWLAKNNTSEVKNTVQIVCLLPEKTAGPPQHRNHHRHNGHVPQQHAALQQPQLLEQPNGNRVHGF